MALHISPALSDFLAERHLATLVTLRADGSPHAVPVGFTYADGMARVITSVGSVKVANVRRDPRVSLTQVDGRRWVTLAGPAIVHDDAGRVATAVAMYERRYRPPRANPERVVIEVDVQQLLCNPSLR